MEWYEASQVSVDNGTLSLTATPGQTHGKQYISGMVSSYGKFSFTYGYAQIVAMLPSGQGLWSAFWTLPAAGGWPPEIDIMENWAQTETIHVFLHDGKSGRAQASVILPTYSDKFHTYGVDWEPGSISWYVDGTLYGRFAISHHDAGGLLASLAVRREPGPQLLGPVPPEPADPIDPGVAAPASGQVPRRLLTLSPASIDKRGSPAPVSLREQSVFAAQRNSR